ncbi:hypothetical protein ACLKA7_007490 [Drosophila subpalustris]
MCNLQPEAQASLPPFAPSPLQATVLDRLVYLTTFRHRPWPPIGGVFVLRSVCSLALPSGWPSYAGNEKTSSPSSDWQRVHHMKRHNHHNRIDTLNERAEQT